jgi:hypothetical protein
MSFYFDSSSMVKSLERVASTIETADVISEEVVNTFLDFITYLQVERWACFNEKQWVQLCHLKRDVEVTLSRRQEDLYCVYREGG